MKLINLFLSALFIYIQTIEIQAVIEEQETPTELVNKYKNDENLRQKHAEFKHLKTSWNLLKNYREYKAANKAQNQLNKTQDQIDVGRLRLQEHEKERNQILDKKISFWRLLNYRKYNIAKQAENSLNLSNINKDKLEEILENPNIINTLSTQEIEKINPKNLANVLLNKKIIQRLTDLGQRIKNLLQNKKQSVSKIDHNLQPIPDSFVYALTQEQAQAIIDLHNKDQKSSNFEDIFSKEQQIYLQKFASAEASDPIQNIRIAVNAQELSDPEQKQLLKYLKEISTHQKQLLIKVFEKNIEKLQLEPEVQEARINIFKNMMKQSIQSYEWIINLKNNNNTHEFQIIDMGNIDPIKDPQYYSDSNNSLQYKYQTLLDNNIINKDNYSYQKFEKAYARWIISEIDLNKNITETTLTIKNKANYIINISGLIRALSENKLSESPTNNTLLKSIKDRLAKKINQFLKKNDITQLNHDYISYINTETLNKLDLSKLDMLQTKALSFQQIQALSKKSIQKLNINDLSPEQTTYFKPAQMKYFTNQQIQNMPFFKFTESQIKALTNDQVKAITLKNLNDKQIQAFSYNQIKSFTKDQIEDMGTPKFTKEQIQALDDIQINTLTIRQIMQFAQDFSIEQINILKLKITKLNRADLNLLSLHQDLPKDLKDFIKNIIEKSHLPESKIQSYINKKKDSVQKLTPEILKKLSIFDFEHDYPLSYFSDDQIRYILENNENTFTLIYVLEHITNKIDQNSINKALELIFQNPNAIKQLERSKNPTVKEFINNYLTTNLETITKDLPKATSSFYTQQLRNKIEDIKTSLENLSDEISKGYYTKVAETILQTTKIMQNIIQQITIEESKIKKDKEESKIPEDFTEESLLSFSPQDSRQTDLTLLDSLKSNFQKIINDLTLLEKAQLGLMAVTITSTVKLQNPIETTLSTTEFTDESTAAVGPSTMDVVNKTTGYIRSLGNWAYSQAFKPSQTSDEQSE